LKKHLVLSHKDKYEQIKEKYPFKNFYDVYRTLLNNLTEFPFIEFKRQDVSTTQREDTLVENLTEGVGEGLFDENIEKPHEAFSDVLSNILSKQSALIKLVYNNIYLVNSEILKYLNLGKFKILIFSTD
jgi:hypothetical protein